VELRGIEPLPVAETAVLPIAPQPHRTDTLIPLTFEDVIPIFFLPIPRKKLLDVTLIGIVLIEKRENMGKICLKSGKSILTRN
jgi:hypothetical protein